MQVWNQPNIYQIQSQKLPVIHTHENKSNVKYYSQILLAILTMQVWNQPNIYNKSKVLVPKIAGNKYSDDFSSNFWEQNCMASRQFHYTLNRKVRIVIFENLLPENAGTSSLKFRLYCHRVQWNWRLRRQFQSIIYLARYT